MNSQLHSRSTAKMNHQRSNQIPAATNRPQSLRVLFQDKLSIQQSLSYIGSRLAARENIHKSYKCRPMSQIKKNSHTRKTAVVLRRQNIDKADHKHNWNSNTVRISRDQNGHYHDSKAKDPVVGQRLKFKKTQENESEGYLINKLQLMATALSNNDSQPILITNKKLCLLHDEPGVMFSGDSSLNKSINFLEHQAQKFLGVKFTQLSQLQKCSSDTEHKQDLCTYYNEGNISTQGIRNIDKRLQEMRSVFKPEERSDCVRMNDCTIPGTLLKTINSKPMRKIGHKNHYLTHNNFMRSDPYMRM